LESAFVLFLGVIGALIGAALLLKWHGTFDHKTHPSAHLFIRRPETIFWICLICGQTALWTVLSLPVVRALRAQGLPRRWTGIVLSSLVLIATLTLFMIVAGRIRNDYPLPHHAQKIIVLTVWGFLLALITSVVIWLVHDQAGRYTTMTHEPTKDELDAVMHLQDTLGQMLTILGAVIGAAVLATAALRRALAAWNTYVDAHPKLHLVSAGEVPYVYVLLYGGFFSLLLALIYFPTFLEIQAAGRRIRDHAAALPDPSGKSFDDVVTRRKNLEDLLQLDVATSNSFRAGVAILAPLTTSLLGLLFKA